MKLNNIDLNKLKIFHSVMKHGGYLQASEELGLTRSAISQAITTLESQLGVSLFQRKGRKLIPNEKSRQLFPTLNQSLIQIESAISEKLQEKAAVKGQIRIGSYYEFAQNKLTHVLKQFLKKHPDVQFKFQFDSPSKLHRKLEKSQLDMCFSIYPHNGRKDIESLQVFKQELVLIAPVQWRVLKTKFSQITEHPIVDYYPNHSLINRWAKHHFKIKKKVQNILIYAASSGVLLEMVKAQLGLGVLPVYLLQTGDFKFVKIIQPSKEPLTDFIWLNQYQDQFENSAHKAFYNFCQTYFI